MTQQRYRDLADWPAAAWLWAISAALVVLAAVALERRDVGA